MSRKSELRKKSLPYTYKPQVQTIEQTGKGLKLQILLSIAMGISSFIWFTKLENPQIEGHVPAALVGISIVWFVITKILIWWRHK